MKSSALSQWWGNYWVLNNLILSLIWKPCFALPYILIFKVQYLSNDFHDVKLDVNTWLEMVAQILSILFFFPSAEVDFSMTGFLGLEWFFLSFIESVLFLFVRIILKALNFIPAFSFFVMILLTIISIFQELWQFLLILSFTLLLFHDLP